MGQKRENRALVSYGNFTIFFALIEILQGLQSYEFIKLEQLKQHYRTLLKTGREHLESETWVNAFKALTDEAKVDLMLELRGSSAYNWKKSYNFSNLKWTLEKETLALQLRK